MRATSWLGRGLPRGLVAWPKGGRLSGRHGPVYQALLPGPVYQEEPSRAAGTRSNREAVPTGALSSTSKAVRSPRW